MSVRTAQNLMLVYHIMLLKISQMRGITEDIMIIIQ